MSSKPLFSKLIHTVEVVIGIFDCVHEMKFAGFVLEKFNNLLRENINCWIHCCVRQRSNLARLRIVFDPERISITHIVQQNFQLAYSATDSNTELFSAAVISVDLGGGASVSTDLMMIGGV